MEIIDKPSIGESTDITMFLTKQEMMVMFYSFTYLITGLFETNRDRRFTYIKPIKEITEIIEPLLQDTFEDSMNLLLSNEGIYFTKQDYKNNEPFKAITLKIGHWNTIYTSLYNYRQVELTYPKRTRGEKKTLAWTNKSIFISRIVALIHYTHDLDLTKQQGKEIIIKRDYI